MIDPQTLACLTGARRVYVSKDVWEQLEKHVLSGESIGVEGVEILRSDLLPSGTVLRDPRELLDLNIKLL